MLHSSVLGLEGLFRHCSNTAGTAVQASPDPAGIHSTADTHVCKRKYIGICPCAKHTLALLAALSHLNMQGSASVFSVLSSNFKSVHTDRGHTRKYRMERTRFSVKILCP